MRSVIIVSIPRLVYLRDFYESNNQTCKYLSYLPTYLTCHLGTRVIETKPPINPSVSLFTRNC